MRDQHLKGTDSLEGLAAWRRERCWVRPEHTVRGGQVCSSQCEHNRADLHFSGVLTCSHRADHRVQGWWPEDHLGDRLTSLCGSVIIRA